MRAKFTTQGLRAEDLDITLEAKTSAEDPDLFEFIIEEMSGIEWRKGCHYDGFQLLIKDIEDCNGTILDTKGEWQVINEDLLEVLNNYALNDDIAFKGVCFLFEKCGYSLEKAIENAEEVMFALELDEYARGYLNHHCPKAIEELGDFAFCLNYEMLEEYLEEQELICSYKDLYVLNPKDFQPKEIEPKK